VVQMNRFLLLSSTLAGLHRTGQASSTITASSQLSSSAASSRLLLGRVKHIQLKYHHC
jgi:hypothetical protein